MEEALEGWDFSEEQKPYNIRHRAYLFAKDVTLFVGECKFERVYSSLFDQLIRSATSVGANLVEAKSGSSKKDWKNYFAIALKSANETKYWLCLIRDTQSVSKTKVETLLNEADELSKIIASIILNAS
jgi:four helix bundle protein